MDRILAMYLVGAWPGNVFGPGMSAAALESFNRDVRTKAVGNISRGGAATAAAAARTTASMAGSGGGGGGKCCAAGQRTAEKEANGGGGASGDMKRSCPAALDLDQRFDFVDAVVAPY